MKGSTWLQNHTDIGDANSSIEEMVKEKGNTCVSIIVPTHRLGQDRHGDRVEIQRAISAAKHGILSEPGNFLLDLDDLFQHIDFKRNKEGIGIFVSPHIKKLVKFPFPVTKKIVVNKFFHLHDLLYIAYYETAYFLVDISKKEVHLFKGVMDHLQEIQDEDFPKEFIEEYEYQKPAPSGSGRSASHVRDVERDKSVLRQIRLKNFFQKVDKLLSKHLVKKDTPLLLCGSEKAVSIYKSVTDHPSNIVTSISDNHKGTAIRHLEVLAWLQIRQFLDERRLKLIDEFKEKCGAGLGVSGTEDVWTAAKEGRGLILLVEKDYGKAAFISQDGRLHLQHPQEKFVRYPDVVNEIIGTVLEKGGKIVIVEKDILRDYNRIALITRY